MHRHRFAGFLRGVGNETRLGTAGRERIDHLLDRGQQQDLAEIKLERGRSDDRVGGCEPSPRELELAAAVDLVRNDRVRPVNKERIDLDRVPGGGVDVALKVDASQPVALGRREVRVCLQEEGLGDLELQAIYQSVSKIFQRLIDPRRIACELTVSPEGSTT